ncbi:receptor-like protein 2 [Hordeum vulgare subsp. vulgare]|uniref:receptor-like protein 2 n=1 Tax=Hordeum vulgare subsp. vulgare TaxID=112509 RepID=UPI001D1A5A19|nr:receptor-like protein 2 [Hordeum vulgare subsp. vulgare]
MTALPSSWAGSYTWAASCRPASSSRLQPRRAPKPANSAQLLLASRLPKPVLSPPTGLLGPRDIRYFKSSLIKNHASDRDISPKPFSHLGFRAYQNPSSSLLSPQPPAAAGLPEPIRGPDPPPPLASVSCSSSSRSGQHRRHLPLLLCPRSYPRRSLVAIAGEPQEHPTRTCPAPRRRQSPPQAEVAAARDPPPLAWIWPRADPRRCRLPLLSCPRSFPPGRWSPLSASHHSTPLGPAPPHAIDSRRHKLRSPPPEVLHPSPGSGQGPTLVAADLAAGQPRAASKVPYSHCTLKYAYYDYYSTVHVKQPFVLAVPFHGVVAHARPRVAQCQQQLHRRDPVNVFGGAIPIGFGNCSRLRILSDGRNNLTGEIPDDLFDAMSLEQLALPSSRIQGRLDHLQIATLINLVKLDLTYNALTDELSESIGELTMLEELRLGKNNLTGTMPMIGNWTSLRYLDLRSNSFVGDLGAVDFSRLTNLTFLNLAAKNLTGTMPPNLYSCTSMMALRVANNDINGQVASAIGNMRELQFLSLTINNFTNISGMFRNFQGCKDLIALLISYNFYGEALTDASWVGDHVSNVRVIIMKECGLRGHIQLWMPKLQGLNVLNLAGNRLADPIPSWLDAVKKLYYVDLSGNYFVGELPPSLMEVPVPTSENAMTEFNPAPLPLVFNVTPDNMATVRTGRTYFQMSGVAAILNLSDNDISGLILLKVRQMKTLQVLDLSYDNLSGGITLELSGLTESEILDLRQNRLTGSIPPTLTKLHFLSDFNVAHNDLEGPIPTRRQFDAFLATNFAGNPKLCSEAISVRRDNKTETTTFIVQAGGGGDSLAAAAHARCLRRASEEGMGRKQTTTIWKREGRESTTTTTSQCCLG